MFVEYAESVLEMWNAFTALPSTRAPWKCVPNVCLFPKRIVTYIHICLSIYNFAPPPLIALVR